MKGLYTILLLIVSNVFMTFAWYGHLKLQDMKIITNWPLYAIILFSWSIALAEYFCLVPANRIGFTLIIFTVFTTVLFKGESLHWNHFAAFICLVLAVYFVFYK